MTTMNEYRFQSGTTATQNLVLAAGTNTYFSNHALKGEIKSVEWKTNTAGSMFLMQSGTNLPVFTCLTPSGTNWQRVIPAQFSASTVGGTTLGSIAGALHNPLPVCEPLMLAFSGAGASESGTFVVRYR